MGRGGQATAAGRDPGKGQPAAVRAPPVGSAPPAGSARPGEGTRAAGSSRGADRSSCLPTGRESAPAAHPALPHPGPGGAVRPGAACWVGALRGERLRGRFAAPREVAAKLGGPAAL